MAGGSSGMNICGGQGVPLGPSNAPVQLVEFSDFECPYCASLHAGLKSVLERFPADVAITYVHFPLSMHRSKYLLRG